MAMTGNKICGVCGEPIGTISALYFAPEMNDNCYMCSACRAKCSPYLDDKQIHAWKKYDAENHMAFLAECEDRLQSDFHESDSVCLKDRKLLAVDAAKGWWYVPGTADIFRLEQIRSWQLSISTSSDEDTGLHLFKFTPPRPGMPAPGRLEELTGMSLVIELAEHPYAQYVTVEITGEKPLFGLYKTYINDAYKAAESCYRLLEKYADPSVTGTIRF